MSSSVVTKKACIQRDDDAMTYDVASLTDELFQMTRHNVIGTKSKNKS